MNPRTAHHRLRFSRPPPSTTRPHQHVIFDKLFGMAHPRLWMTLSQPNAHVDLRRGFSGRAPVDARTFQNHWCSRMDLNHRPLDYQSSTLPTELREHIWNPKQESNPHKTVVRSHALYPLSYWGLPTFCLPIHSKWQCSHHNDTHFASHKVHIILYLGWLTELESAPFGATIRRSSQLSYSHMERMTGLEPATSCLEGRRSAN